MSNDDQIDEVAEPLQQGDGNVLARDVGYLSARVGETLSQFRQRLRAQAKRARTSRLKRKVERIQEEIQQQEPGTTEESERLAAEEESQAKELARIMQVVADKTSDQAIDLATDAIWAYRNLGCPVADLESAPSTGAVTLLNWAKESDANRRDFYKGLVVRAFAIQAEREKAERESREKEAAKKKAEEEKDKEKDPTLDEVERLLKGFTKGKR